MAVQSEKWPWGRAASVWFWQCAPYRSAARHVRERCYIDRRQGVLRPGQVDPDVWTGGASQEKSV